MEWVKIKISRMINKYFFFICIAQETSETAAVMFFFFALCVSWILVNVMLTIIIEGFEKVKEELRGRKNELEVIQYIRDMSRYLVGLREKPNFVIEYAPDGPSAALVQETDEYKRQREEEEEGSSTVRELPEKVDLFLQVAIFPFVNFFWVETIRIQFALVNLVFV